MEPAEKRGVWGLSPGVPPAHRPTGDTNAAQAHSDHHGGAAEYFTPARARVHHRPARKGPPSQGCLWNTGLPGASCLPCALQTHVGPQGHTLPHARPQNQSHTLEPTAQDPTGSGWMDLGLCPHNTQIHAHSLFTPLIPRYTHTPEAHRLAQYLDRCVWRHTEPGANRPHATPM